MIQSSKTKKSNSTLLFSLLMILSLLLVLPSASAGSVSFKNTPIGAELAPVTVNNINPVCNAKAVCLEDKKGLRLTVCGESGATIVNTQCEANSYCGEKLIFPELVVDGHTDTVALTKEAACYVCEGRVLTNNEIYLTKKGVCGAECTTTRFSSMFIPEVHDCSDEVEVCDSNPESPAVGTCVLNADANALVLSENLRNRFEVRQENNQIVAPQVVEFNTVSSNQELEITRFKSTKRLTLSKKGESETLFEFEGQFARGNVDLTELDIIIEGNNVIFENLDTVKNIGEVKLYLDAASGKGVFICPRANSAQDATTECKPIITFDDQEVNGRITKDGWTVKREGSKYIVEKSLG